MKRHQQWLGLLAVLAIAAWLGWRQYELRWLNEPIAAIHEPVTFEVRTRRVARRRSERPR